MCVSSRIGLSSNLAFLTRKKRISKENKRWRMVVDYRMLNETTISDAYPLPNMTEILDAQNEELGIEIMIRKRKIF
jgi:hypothetical protein